MLRKTTLKLFALLGLVLSFASDGATAAPIFPEDGSIRAGTWWVPRDAEKSLIPFPRLEDLLRGYGIGLAVSQFDYTYLQDVLLFDVDGKVLIQPDMRRAHPSALHDLRLRDLTLGIYNGQENRLTRYDEESVTADRQSFRSLRGTLVEGGALITGRKSDGSTYAITPIETVKRTQSFLGLTEPEARQAIADDFEIPVENLITLTPTAGHLDLSIQAFPGGVVLVYDPRLTAPFLRTARADPATTRDEKTLLDEMIAEAARSADASNPTLFDRNAEAIRAAGLTVIRTAGRFSIPQPWLNTRRSFERINFFNGTVLRGAQDELLVLTNRADGLPSLQRAWAHSLSQRVGLSPENIHFIGSYAIGAGLDCAGATSP